MWVKMNLYCIFYVQKHEKQVDPRGVPFKISVSEISDDFNHYKPDSFQIHWTKLSTVVVAFNIVSFREIFWPT